MKPGALLLAAGKSTRLGPMSSLRPKPLMPVCNVPLIKWNLHLYRAFGFQDVMINLHHLGHLISDELGDGSSLGIQIRYSKEPIILGTGGGIKSMAAHFPEQACFAINAKIIIDMDLSAVLAFHQKQGALATMVVYPHPYAERWGAIYLNEQHQILQILDHRSPNLGNQEISPYQFTGIHLLEPEFFKYIPDGPCCIVRSAYARLIEQGAPIFAYLHKGYFYDHSTPARYLQGNINMLENPIASQFLPNSIQGKSELAEIHESAHLIPPFIIGDHAYVERNAILGPNVVMGEHSRVKAGMTLENAVVWPNANVDQSGSHLIVTPQGVCAVESYDDPTAAPR